MRGGGGGRRRAKGVGVGGCCEIEALWNRLREEGNCSANKIKCTEK